MKTNEDNPYDALEKIFHEPNRLAIMSHLCAADGGVSFGELRDACNLTDGNLNRHLKVLEESGAVKIAKAFVDAKPRTTVTISKTGLDRFGEYLAALSDVLQQANKSMPAEKRKELGILAARTVRA